MSCLNPTYVAPVEGQLVEWKRPITKRRELSSVPWPPVSGDLVFLERPLLLPPALQADKGNEP